MSIHTKKAGPKFSDEQKKFEAVFYGAESPLVLFKGPEMLFEMFNEKYQQIYHARDLLGKPLLEALPELKNSVFPAILKKVYETGEHLVSHEGLARIYNPVTDLLEERYFDTAFSRISLEEGGPFRIMATPREVTDRVVQRKKIEANLLELEQERELREKFVSALTHDLRNPLAIARVGAQILKRKTDDPETVISMADQIVINIDRAVRMIHDLLDANFIKVGKELPISVHDCRLDLIVADVINGLEELYGKRFKIKNEAGEIFGRWDALGIHRLIENLASNAVKYGDSKSDVTITMSLDKNWAEIKVHNLGDPIPLEEQNDLFNHYRRSQSAIKSRTIGWGIGLALVKALVEAHNGAVRLVSNPEDGTTFFVKLPLDLGGTH